MAFMSMDVSLPARTFSLFWRALKFGQLPGHLPREGIWLCNAQVCIGIVEGVCTGLRYLAKLSSFRSSQDRVTYLACSYRVERVPREILDNREIETRKRHFIQS